MPADERQSAQRRGMVAVSVCWENNPDAKKFESASTRRLRLVCGEHVNVLVGSGGVLWKFPKNGVDCDEDTFEFDHSSIGR
jgi:hypothetical protein